MKGETIEATRRLTFCAAHRLVGYKGLCRFLHGHNYEVLVTVRSDTAALPGAINSDDVECYLDVWLGDNWDHATILVTGDPLIASLSSANSGARRRGESAPAGRLFVMEANPTAENMARHLLGIAREKFDGPGRWVHSVEVCETENGRATARCEQ